jgi:hypothetical protein
MSPAPWSILAYEDQIQAMVDTAVDEFGGLDILHNNAAVTGVSDEAGFITGETINVDGGMTAHYPNYAEVVDALEVTA